MPDLPANTSTTASVALGEIYENTLDTIGDRDWIMLDLDYASSSSVTVTLQGQGVNGFGLFDSYVRIYDSEGILIAENDDISSDQVASRVTFDVSANANVPFYIEAAAFYDNESGDYQVSVRDADDPLNDGLLAALNWGTAQDDNTVTVRFVSNGQSRDTGDVDFGTMTSEGFNNYEKAQFAAAFAQIEAVCGLTFDIVTSANADFELLLDTNEFANVQGGDGILGFFNPPNEIGEGVGVFNGNAWDRQSDGDLQKGGFGYVTIVHELLHGLGLAHPHDNGGSSTILDGVTTEFEDYGDENLNQGIFTTMSYNSGYATGTNGSAPQSTNYGFEMGPMALDIALLQALYGVNNNHKNGNSTYTLADVNEAGTGWQAIGDTGGTDKIVAVGNKDAFIDLRAATLESDFGGGGRVSAHRGVAGGYTIANGVVIENAVGADGDDTLRGNNAANTLDGGAGADTLIGEQGEDVLYGRNGNDTIKAGNGHDEIVAGAGSDEIYGGRGDDLIDGEKGTDRIHGKDGDDLIYGGRGKDEIWGGADKDLITGGRGDDYIEAGQNHDEAYGGAGMDTIFGDAGRDQLYGDGGNDKINGGDGKDIIVGGDGDDRIKGGNGADKIWGEDGADRMSGGSGEDVFIFTKTSDSGKNTATADVITDFIVGVDKIDLSDLDGHTSQSGPQDFEMIGGSSFSNAGGEVRWSTSDGDTRIYINTDGDNNSEMRITLENVTGLSAGDFLL